MPRIDSFAQPLLAAYRRALLPTVRQLLDDGEGRLRALLPLCRHRMIHPDSLRRADPNLQSFTNVNRAEDLLHVERILQDPNPDSPYDPPDTPHTDPPDDEGEAQPWLSTAES